MTLLKERQKAADLLRMVVARHEGEGWQVFTELSSGISARDPRRADAVAMGLWPSQGMEVHGYEIKVSRGDARKELQQPKKSEAIGRYCDYWWLVVGDEAIVDGLLVPPTWGVLAPRNRVLRIVRKAPKRRADPLDRRFVAAMMRSANVDRVLKARHEEIVAGLQQRINELVSRPGNAEAEQMRQAIAEFQEASGVDISARWHGHKALGEAVRIVLDLMRDVDPRGLRHRSQYLHREADQYERHAADARERAQSLEDILDKVEGMVRTDSNGAATDARAIDQDLG